MGFMDNGHEVWGPFHFTIPTSFSYYSKLFYTFFLLPILEIPFSQGNLDNTCTNDTKDIGI